MNFATWSLRNPIPAILLFALLSLAGLRGFQQLSIQDMPDLDLPTINIVLSQPGAAPAQLETEVARKVEDSLVAVQGLKHVSSSVSDGMVHIKAEFVLEKPLSDALIETKDAVDRVRSDLPTDLEQPSVSAVTNSDGATLTYAVASGRMDEEALSWFIDDELSKAMMRVPGVGRVVRKGGAWLGGAAIWRGSVINASAEALSATGDAEGKRFKFELDRSFKSGVLTVTPRISATWYDSKYVDYYYGVRANEVRSGRARYIGESTTNAELGVRFGYAIKQRHNVFVDLSVTKLGSTIKDSPLVEKSNESSVKFGYLYAF